MSVYDWSKTAADNDDADSDINWAEGQAPSTVNNSARAMMQKLAYLRSHMTGQTTSAGSSNAYTLTTGESLSAYPAGFACVFEANHTNTGAATLNVDAIGAKSIKKKHDEALEAGDIESGGLYYVIYDSGDDAFQLISPTATALDSGDIGVSVQAYDAQLADFAGLTQAADTLPYFDTASTMTTTSFTSFARTLLDDTTASAARTTLGVAIGTDVQAWDAALDDFAGLTQAADRLPYFDTASTMAVATFTSFARTLIDDADAATARATLGLVIGTNVQAWDAALDDFAGLTQAADRLPYFDSASTMAVATFTSFGRSLVDDADASAARTTLGLGSIATQAASSVSITGGSITGITDLAVADGGTGASTAAGARTNLGLVIGTDVQAWDAALDDFAGLTQAADTLPYFATASTMATTSFTSFARTLLDDADASAARTTLGVAIGTNVQAWDAALDDFAGLTQAADRLPYFDTASTMAVATFTSFGRSLVDDADASAARTTLGLGSIATQAASSVSITGGSISGITDLAVADGGTGASTAASARTNLGLVIGTDVQAYSANLAAIAALAVTDSNIIVGNGSTWVAESGATARTTLGLGSIATQAASSVAITGGAIDGTAIGGTTAAAGAFTTLTANGYFNNTLSTTGIIQNCIDSANSINWQVGSDGSAIYVGTQTNHPLRIVANNSEAIRVATSGNVGIGTTSPNAKLSFGTSAGLNGLYLYDGGGAGAHGFGISANTLNIFADATSTSNATIAFGKYDKTTFTEWMRIKDSNVGIGTTSPSGAARLTVSGNIALGGPPGHNDATTQTVGIWTTGDPISDNRARIEFITTAGVSSSSSAIGFLTNEYGVSEGTRMYISPAGNVGIGETIPDYRLDVNGTFGFTPGASVTPVDNGDVVFEATSNTTFTIKHKGSDGTVRSGTITLS